MLRVKKLNDQKPSNHQTHHFHVGQVGIWKTLVEMQSSREEGGFSEEANFERERRFPK